MPAAQNGVQPGQAVADARGLLGRIYVSGRADLLGHPVDDLNSRIPVLIRPGNVEAILAGNNSSEPTLEALPQNAKLEERRGGGDFRRRWACCLRACPSGCSGSNGAEAQVALYADPLGGRRGSYPRLQIAHRDNAQAFGQRPSSARQEACSSTSADRHNLRQPPAALPPQADQHAAPGGGNAPPNLSARGPNSVNVIRPTYERARRKAPRDSSDDQNESVNRVAAGCLACPFLRCSPPSFPVLCGLIGVRSVEHAGLSHRAARCRRRCSGSCRFISGVWSGRT